MKIFEATTLLSAAKQRATEYKELRSQMTNLKNAFQGMADLGDSDFSSKGADNIKALFQDHAGVTDEWLELIDMKIAFLTSIEAMIEDAGLSDSYVEESFLEHELTNALDKSKAIMQEQRNEMKGILDEIADILPLDLFSTDNADQKLDDSDKTKRETIQKIGELDNNLSNEYGLSEANEAFIIADFQALQDATGKGKNATPLNYNAKAYQESEIHQMQAGLHKQSSEYLSFKKQQAEERRIAKEQEELANRPWYEKTWNVVCDFTGEVTGYYDYKRAADGVDPVTGEKLTAGQRVAAGGMAAAGYVPIVGWAGRIFKGGKAIYSTGKAIYKADKALEIYKTPKTFQALQHSEKGLYGLASANGFSEAVTGRDMFGNKVSDERQKNGFHQALAAISPIGMIGTGKVLKANAGTGKPSNLFRGENFPYAAKRENGIGKSYISPETGNLIPANKSGMYKGRQVTVTEHILGGYRRGGKSNSPYTSFTVNKKIAKGYGDHTIELDISSLRKAIRSGKLKGVAILNPKQIERLIKNDTRQTDNWKNKALKWTNRDTEYFVKGEIPKEYFKMFSKE
ncbi:ribonuclease YeeF family protein [Bacillus velezensis]|uniref:ribonuclease YeeF family protein n=1 Tax=Bacillus velezensis TaxID=492670 RepID=UPI003F72D7F8